jgi:hypothetical protein
MLAKMKFEDCHKNKQMFIFTNQSLDKSGLENREYGRGDPLRWPRDTLYPQKLPLTSPTSGGRSVGIVRLRTKATEFVILGQNSINTSCNLIGETVVKLNIVVCLYGD